MRLLGTQTDEKLALRFWNYLESQNISSRIDPDGDSYHIWVFQEDDVEKAKSAYAEFLQDPENSKFVAADQLAAKLKKAREKAEKKNRSAKQVRMPWQQRQQSDFPVTILLIVISVTVTLLTSFGQSDNRLSKSLMISNVEVFNREFNASGEIVSERLVKKLPEVEKGQVWRLITPIFLHLSPMHLVFNMLITFQFGSFIERRKGSFFLLMRVLLIALLSNLLQFYFSGPLFGGMSGVDYGLFGYLWMKGIVSPEEGLGLNEQTIFIMLVWFIICFFTAGIANFAHAGGLFIGIVLGAAPGLIRRRR